MKVVPTYLPAIKGKIALSLWRQGDDTFEIARRLNATEAQVYNTLHLLRDLRKAA